jgi:hypothetical protein
MTINADRCPTCDGAETILLRGERVACPTCCATRHFSAPVQGALDTLRGRSHGSPLVFLALALAAIATVAVLLAYVPQLKSYF